MWFPGGVSDDSPPGFYDAHKEEKMLWWGYRHVSGTYQVKRYFSKLDVEEAHQSDFCAEVVGPFEASGRDEALKIVKQLTK